MRGFFLAAVWGVYPFLRVLPLAVSPLRRVPFANAQKEPKRWAPAFGTSLWLGVPSLRDSSGGIAYGLLRCTSSRCMRLRRTVAALPPPDKSLHSAFRWGRHVKSGTRANAHRVEWWRAEAEAAAEVEAGAEKAGVELYAFQNPSSARYFTSAYLYKTPQSVPSPSGRSDVSGGLE